MVGVNRDASITGISLNDPITPLANVVTTFAVEHGSLSFLTNIASGLTAGQILGNGTNLVTILAPVASINATLAVPNGLIYTPGVGYTGADNLSITSEDPLEDTANANVALAVAGPISITVPTTTQLVNPNGPTFLVSLNDPGLPDSGLVTVTFHATHGTILIPTYPDLPGLLTADEVTGNRTGNVVVTATLAEINATLPSGIFYAATVGYAGPDSVVINASDQVGNVGTASFDIIADGPLTITVPASSTQLRLRTAVDLGRIACGPSFSIERRHQPCHQGVQRASEPGDQHSRRSDHRRCLRGRVICIRPRDTVTNQHHAGCRERFELRARPGIQRSGQHQVLSK